MATVLKILSTNRRLLPRKTRELSSLFSRDIGTAGTDLDIQ